MDADLEMVFSGFQNYEISREFSDGKTEVVCFPFILEQALFDIDTEKERRKVLKVVSSCFFESLDTKNRISESWSVSQESSGHLGGLFRANFHLELQKGFFDDSFKLEREYSPSSSTSFDIELSISMALYAADLEGDLSPENMKLTVNILRKQLDYYRKNGLVGQETTDIPLMAVKDILD